MNKFTNSIKKLTAGVMAAAVLSTGAVFAADTDIDTISINGNIIEDAQILTVDGQAFVPVRALCEGMGMEVQWDNEAQMVTIVDMPLYVTFSPTADGYTFARTAPMLLGSSPVLKEGRTYVPVTFIGEILKKEFTISEEGDINVTAEIDNSVGAIVLETITEEGNTAIKVMDSKRGEEVIVNITAETAITDADGNALTADVLEKNAEIRVEYAEFMTMSIPPMTNAVKIQFLGIIEDEATPVTILEKNTEDDVTSITIFDTERNSDIIVNITEETAITDKDGNALTMDALSVGMDVEVEFADFMTMSIPPMTAAVSIKVVEAKATTTVMAEDAEAKTITVFSKEMNMPLILNISEETAITDAEGNTLAIDAIERGTELASFEYAEAMTKSIPPQTNAIKIVVAK